MKQAIPKKLLLLLAAIFALSPFAIDGYLPAIPIIAQDLNSETSLVAVTVSLYVLGLAIGQLIGGPLSDRFGRMPIIVVGLSIFATGSILIANAQSLEMLWALRIIQSLGGGIAVVGIPAIIRDVAVGKEAAKLFSLLMLIGTLAPAIAPTFGTVVLETLGWHWIFILLGFFAGTVAVCSPFLLPKVKKTKERKVTGGYLSVFKERRALGYLLTQGFAFAVLMTFLTNAPFAYLEHFQIDTSLFSGLLIANVIGIAVVNRINNYLLNKHDPASLLQLFLGMQLIGLLILVLATFFTPDNLGFAVIGVVISLSAIGGILSNSSTVFMQYFEKNAGTASALLGSAQFGISAAVSGIAAMLSQDTLWPMILAMLVSTVIALTAAVKSAQGGAGNLTIPEDQLGEPIFMGAHNTVFCPDF